MSTDTDLIAARLAALPISSTERDKALRHLATGDAIASALIAIARWLEPTHFLRPSYQD